MAVLDVMLQGTMVLNCIQDMTINCKFDAMFSTLKYNHFLPAQLMREKVEPMLS